VSRPSLRAPGLRQRVVLAYLAGGVLLSVLSGALTWSLSTNYLLAQRTRIATDEALDSALVVQQGVSTAERIPRVLEQVAGPRMEALLRYRGETWYSGSLAVESGDLPAALVAGVASGRVLRQRIEVDDEPYLAVGVPLDDVDAEYFALISLDEIDRTFEALALVLVGTAVATAVAASALGVWTSRRALRPLERLNEVAGRVAQGDLSARLRTEDRDLRELSATFNRTADDLAERVQREIRFAGDVSHELRSPVTTMSNAVALLWNRRDELPPTAVTVVEMLRAEVERFRRIVGDLLEISAHGGDIAMAGETVRIAELVRRACEGEVHPDRIDVSSEAERALLCGDPRRLHRVVVNLVENARVHGGGVVRVAVRVDGDRVCVAVEDAGPGVPPGDRSSVFERFHRGRRARSDVEGTGLGLALVAQHVRAHAGTVRVEDQPGGGARFVVELPRQEAMQ
jgi:two-component system sensor histidine kinase MtrB